MVIAPILYVGYAAAGAVLDTVFQILVVTAAVFAQSIERTVAEQAVEGFRMLCRMAREKFALLVLREFIIFGLDSLFTLLAKLILG